MRPTPLPPIAILAGGVASRMRPLTEKVPKAMLEVAGEPFIAHQLRLLARRGLQRVVLCTGYLGGQIRDFVGDGGRFGLGVAYAPDGPLPLGTGGAVRHALPLLGEEFFVTYGDAYLDDDYHAMHAAYRASGLDGLMVVFRNRGAGDASNAGLSGGLVSYDKRHPSPDMSFIDWGVSLLRSSAFVSRPSDAAFDLADVLEDLSRRHQLAGFETLTPFREIGSPAGLEEAERHLRATA